MKIYEMKKEFVHRVPAELEEGILYVCLDCDVVVHKCACGCGEKVVLPLSPEHWKLTYDGEVTLSPSIGNYQYECKSHYFIRNGNVVWVESFKEEFKSKKKRKKKKKTFFKQFKR
jgi:hypothetical protein